MDGEDPNYDRLAQVCKDLAEHFDSVQIIATSHEPTTEGGTVIYMHGQGNIYARIGSTREWLLMMDKKSGTKEE